MNKEKFFNIVFYSFVSFCSVLMFVCSICYLVYAERYKEHLENCPNCSDMNLTYNLSTADVNVSGPFMTNNILIPVGGYYDVPLEINPNRVHLLRQDEIYCISFTLSILSDGSTFSFGIIPQATLYNNQDVLDRPGLVTYGYSDNTSFDTWLGGYMSVGSSAVGSGAFNSVRYAFKLQPGFVSSISSFTYLVQDQGFGDSELGQVKLIFYDTNDRTLEVVFAYDVDTYDEVLRLCPSRTVTVGVYSDNDYYNAGYSDGYNTGNSSGYNSGYNVGYNAGYSVGDDVGYQRGVNANSNFTFMNLFGALFDVPVQIITGFLNYELLGFNLLNLATGILTLVIILKIIRFILGGK